MSHQTKFLTEEQMQLEISFHTAVTVEKELGNTKSLNQLNQQEEEELKQLFEKHVGDIPNISELAFHSNLKQTLDKSLAIENFVCNLTENTGMSREQALTWIDKWLSEWLTQQRQANTFAFPSHKLMMLVLSAFVGTPKPLRSGHPKHLFTRPTQDLQPDEEQDELLSYFFESETIYNPNGQEEQVYWAIISEHPKVTMETKLEGADARSKALALTHYLRQAFGAEGLRHLLGYIIAIDENGRQGSFVWSVNEHLERLGYKRLKHGSFDQELIQRALEIKKILTTLKVVIEEKENGKRRLEWESLFLEFGGKEKQQGMEILEHKSRISANDRLYKEALTPTNKQSAKYTKLFKKIAQESHKEHTLTIFLGSLLAILWRQNPVRTLKVKNLMDWCALEYASPKEGGDRNRLRRLKKLEQELEYMKNQGYLGDYSHNGEKLSLSQHNNPFECKLTLTPPRWLHEEIKAIQTKRERFIPPPPPKDGITSEKLTTIQKQSGLSVTKFAEQLGISRETISRMKSGKRKITKAVAQRVIEVFCAKSVT